jgi:WD40 repeat protein
MHKKLLLLSCFLFLACLLSAQTYKTGDKVSIEWKGSWYPGKILEANNGVYKVSYDGYGAEWNEFVSKDRLKPSGDKPLVSDGSTPVSNKEVSYLGVETIWDIDRSADGKLVFAASAYGNVKILDAGSLELLGEIKVGKEPLQTVSVSFDGIYVAVGKMQGGMLMYKRSEGYAYVEQLSVPDYFSISRIRFAPSGYELAVAGAPKEDYKKTQVDVWNAEKKMKTRNLVKSTNDQCAYSDIAWSPDGSRIALGISNAKHGVEIYDAASGKLTTRISTPADVSACAFSPDGKSIAAGGTDQKVTLWNISTGTAVWKFTWGKSGVDYVYGISFSPDGSAVAVCGTGTGRAVEVLNAADGKVKKESGASNPGGNMIRFSTDGSAVYVAFTTYGNVAKVPIVQKFVIN